MNIYLYYLQRMTKGMFHYTVTAWHVYLNNLMRWYQQWQTSLVIFGYVLIMWTSKYGQKIFSSLIYLIQAADMIWLSCKRLLTVSSILLNPWTLASPVILYINITCIRYYLVQSIRYKVLPVILASLILLFDNHVWLSSC